VTFVGSRHVRGIAKQTIKLAFRNFVTFTCSLSKHASSPTKTREIANEFAKRLKKHVAAFKKAYARDGVPFDVMHTDDLH
jgi:hypothetical protein